MSKSEIKRLSVLKGYGLPNGFTKDLPENKGTTMWHSAKECPIKPSFHNMTESSRRIYCHDCGVYWNK